RRWTSWRGGSPRRPPRRSPSPSGSSTARSSRAGTPRSRRRPSHRTSSPPPATSRRAWPRSGSGGRPSSRAGEPGRDRPTLRSRRRSVAAAGRHLEPLGELVDPLPQPLDAAGDPLDRGTVAPRRGSGEVARGLGHLVPQGGEPLGGLAPFVGQPHLAQLLGEPGGERLDLAGVLDRIGRGRQLRGGEVGVVVVPAVARALGAPPPLVALELRGGRPTLGVGAAALLAAATAPGEEHGGGRHDRPEPQWADRPGPAGAAVEGRVVGPSSVALARRARHAPTLPTTGDGPDPLHAIDRPHLLVRAGEPGGEPESGAAGPMAAHPGVREFEDVRAVDRFQPCRRSEPPT